MSEVAGRRPVGVSVIAVVLTIQSIIAALLGVGLIVERNSDSLLEHVDQGSSAILSYGIVAIVWAVVGLAVAWGLWTGKNPARILAGIVEVAQLAGGVYMLFAWSGHYLWQGVWQIAIALLVLWILFNRRADDFFAGRTS
jgi:hypothetical protein